MKFQQDWGPVTTVSFRTGNYICLPNNQSQKFLNSVFRKLDIGLRILEIREICSISLIFKSEFHNIRYIDNTCLDGCSLNLTQESNGQ
jgi:hypothetical protein